LDGREVVVATVAVIGDEASVRAFGLAGVLVLPAADDDAARAAWAALPDGVALVLLTEAAARALDDAPSGAGPPLTAVMGR
jgi:vacuolar-type H+-ATPase subunit F/Vma7